MGNEKELAIEKLKNEEKGLSGSLKILCKMIIDKIPNDEQLAKGILEENKNMNTCYIHLYKWAKTKAEKGSNFCCIEDSVVIGEAIHYFTDVKETKKNVNVETKKDVEVNKYVKNKPVDVKTNEDFKVKPQKTTKDKIEIEEFSLFE